MVWHPRQKIETDADGSAVLELPAESVREARRFVLAYGRHATALAPPELVADLAEEARAMAALYAAPAGKTERPSGNRKKTDPSARS